MRRPASLLAALVLVASPVAASRAPRDIELSLLQEAATRTGFAQQSARWQYARFLLAQGRSAEALGVLDVMDRSPHRAAPPLSARIARGEALMRLGRYQASLGVLLHPHLAADPDACRLRMLAYARSGRPATAIAEWSCAAVGRPRLAKREWQEAKLEAAGAYGRLGQWTSVARLISDLPKSLPEVGYWQGRVAVANGRTALGEKLLEKATSASDPRLALRARIDLIDLQLRSGRITLEQAAKALERRRFDWRGGALEQEIVSRLLEISLRRRDVPAALAWGAVLYRYFDLGAETGSLLTRLRDTLQAAVAPQSGRSLTERASLLWRYRDLLPLGADGDGMIRDLAYQLAGAGLYGRAADLATYQIERRLAPDAGGSMGQIAAEWRMREGRPDLALGVLAKTENRVIDPETAASRDAVAAFALLALDRGGEAFALADDSRRRLPPAMRAELYWQAKDCRRFIDANAAIMPAPGPDLAPPLRTVIIRQAIAAATCKDRAALDTLSARYAGSLREGPLASAFALLTRPDERIAPDALAKALDDLGSATPPPDLAAWLVALPGGRLPVAEPRKG